MFHHVLIATDFSKPAARAAKTARAIADAYGAKVTLMHGVDRDDTDEDRAAAASLLDELQATHFGEVADVQRRSVQNDHADVAICGEAITNKVDLIVAARHGKQTIAEHLLGSTTERVVRHAPCSVLVAHATDDSESFEHIIACTDFSDPSERALEEAAELATRFEAKLTLCHVYSAEAPPFAYEKGEERRHEGMEEAARERLEALRMGLLGGRKAELDVRENRSTVGGVLELAESTDADLVVVGTQGRSGLSRLLIGSVAERVVRHAPCAVLVSRV